MSVLSFRNPGFLVDLTDNGKIRGKSSWEPTPGWGLETDADGRFAF